MTTTVTLPIVWLRHDPFWSYLTILSQRIGNALLDTDRNDGTWLAISVNPPHHSVGHRTREDAERALEGAVLAVGAAMDAEILRREACAWRNEAIRLGHVGYLDRAPDGSIRAIDADRAARAQEVGDVG